MKLDTNHPLFKGLKCSLLMNEGGGKIIYDSSNSMNHATLTRGDWGVDGINLAGVDEFVRIPNFISQNDDWTIFMSFTQDVRNPTSQTGVTVLASMQDGDGGNTGRYILYIHDVSTPSYKISSYIDGASHTSDTVITEGQAYTVALTQNGTAFKFFLNGEEDGSFTATADPANGSLIFFDAKGVSGNNCLNGSCRVIHIYDRPLTVKENTWLDADPTGMYIPDFTPALITAAGEAGVANAGALMMAMMI